MLCGIAGFALGIVLLQQQASLGSWRDLLALLFVLAVLAGVRHVVPWRGLAPWLCHSLHFLSGALAGWLWASVVALWFLSSSLAPELEDQDVVVIGLVSSLPARQANGQRFEFKIERIIAGAETGTVSNIPDKVLLNWYKPAAYGLNTSADSAMTPLLPGERWQLTLRLRRPHGLANPHGFDYEVWLLGQGLRATGTVRSDRTSTFKNQRLTAFVVTPATLVERVRGWLRDRIMHALPDQPYAPVLVALVIGEQHGMSQEDWTIFARTGIGHLISISGLHITMIAGLAAKLFFYLWRHSFFTRAQLPLRLPAQKAAALAGAGSALVYVALAGFGVPAQRTLIMLSIVALAMWFDRISRVSSVLGLALLAVLLLDPWAVLWPGFCLSFVAVGIIFYASAGRRTESMTALPWRQKIRAELISASHTQYVVTVGLVPLTVLLFSQVSLVSPFANAIAIPLISFVVTPCALLGSVFPAPLSQWILGFAHACLHELVTFLSWLSRFSWAVWSAPRPTLLMFLCASAGTLWCLAPRGWPLRWLGLLAWLPLCLNGSSYPLPGEFRVTALDIGQGSALLVETARHRLLYDTGPRYTSGSDAGGRVIVPYLKARGIHHLDSLVVSHADSDHSGGVLSLLKEMRISRVISSIPEQHPVVQAAMAQSLHSGCIAGQSWEWDGIQFAMLHPPESYYADSKESPNARSCTLKISRGEQSLLLTGDIEARQERQLLKAVPDQLRATVLVAPHHGSGTSSTEAFLQAVQPQWALFQFGYRNRYRHPKPVVWQRYADLGIKRLRNDTGGALTVHFGDTIRVEEYRETHARYWHAPLEAGRY